MLSLTARGIALCMLTRYEAAAESLMLAVKVFEGVGLFMSVCMRL